MSTATPPPRIVFFSYSHDSDEHKLWVLRLSEKLRADGYETRLDQYRRKLEKTWARWMLDQLDEADFVLVVCTETYYRRFRGHEQPGKGAGVDWEGSLITQELYDSRGDTDRFVVVLRDPADAAWIPEPLRGRDGPYIPRLDDLDAPGTDRSYTALRERLDEAFGIVPGEVIPRVPLKPRLGPEVVGVTPERRTAPPNPDGRTREDLPTPPKPARSSQPDALSVSLRVGPRTLLGGAVVLVAALWIAAAPWPPWSVEPEHEKKPPASSRPEPSTLQLARGHDASWDSGASRDAYHGSMREPPAESTPLPMLWLATKLTKLPEGLSEVPCPPGDTGFCYRASKRGEVTLTRRGCSPLTVSVVPGGELPKLVFKPKPYPKVCQQPEQRETRHYFATTADGKTVYHARGTKEACVKARDASVKELPNSLVSECRPCERCEGT